MDYLPIKMDMVIKTPEKYRTSKIYGELIDHLEVNNNGLIKVVSVHKLEIEYWIEQDNALDLSADYILCELQNESGLDVPKY